jgi:hypothetical protein
MAKQIGENEFNWTKRLCRANGKLGYFHTWENYSRPIEANPFVGGAPAGVFSKIFGIVEFSGGSVSRVDPSDIVFCDEENEVLTSMEKGEQQNG